MAKILIHIYSHPRLNNTVTLSLFVALTAIREKHDVSIFFAADGVHILNCKKLGEVVGQGTGDLFEHLTKLKQSNANIFVSGLSAKARGYDERILENYNAKFAMPEKIIKLSLSSDSVLCY